MRILFLAPHPFFQPRGTPIADRAVIETLSDLGHEIDVLAYHEGEPVDIPNCRIERIAAPPGVHGVRPGFSAKKIICDGYMLATALRLAGSRHYDLVHAVEESAFIAMILRARYGLPFVYDMDSSIAQQMTERHPVLGIAKGLLELAEGRAIRASVGVLTVCRSLEDVARRHAPGKLVARVEDASLVEAPGTDEAPTELGRPGEGGPVILYAGNLEPYQGIDLL
ncbi:MAG: glycosyltransferase, partial [Gemmatimonadota bacterium]